MSPETATGAPADVGKTISASSFEFFEKLVLDRIGVQLEGKAYLAESRLQDIARRENLPSIDALVDEMRRGNRALTDAGVEAMTTNETSFFRDVHPFETLAEEILPKVFADRPTGKVRIWNGASSSGQESLSMAMVLHESFPAAATSGRVEILSTDVSPEMVARTRDAIYSRFEVNRGLPAGHAQKYFDQEGRKWVAKPILRNLITARELNLLGPWVGIPRCDIVVLRNVLIYFSTAVKQDILRRIRTDVLHPGGCLVLGASETTLGIDPGYEPRRVGRTNLYFPGGTP